MDVCEPMTNTFYRPDERAAGVNDLFTLIAPRYDLMNDLQSFGLHRRWKHRLVALAKARAGDTALDVCCGTGDIAFGLENCGCGDVVGRVGGSGVRAGNVCVMMVNDAEPVMVTQ